MLMMLQIIVWIVFRLLKGIIQTMITPIPFKFLME